MLSKILRELQSDHVKWERCKEFFKVSKIPARTSLLREGEVARSMYFVKEGCLRLWFNKVIGKVSVLWHKHAALRKGEDCVGCFKCVAACRGGALQQRIVAP